MHRYAPLFLTAALAACATGASPGAGTTSGDVARDPAAPPALARAGDTAALRRDLFALAGDGMRGREAGTLDELRASVWVAERAREAGLAPAGDDGTYFQWWPMRRLRPHDASMVALDGQPLSLWRDAAVVSPVDARLDLPLVWVGTDTGQALAARDISGKAVAALVLPPARPPVSWVSLREWRYARSAVNERMAALSRAGAAAILLVADDSTAATFEALSVQMRRGGYNIDTTGAATPPANRVPTLWMPASQRTRVQAARRLVTELRYESFVYPSVNVVARVPGTDPRLRDEHVLFSGHQDHDGTRYAIDGDSIWNGADDNATVSVAMLAIGRAFAERPAPRSALFVWHGAEERGLLGSRWFASRPTVPKAGIVAVLNADMIGRNHPDSAALLGVVAPHRNSPALAAMAFDANRRFTRFAVDTTWDTPTHPEGWYFRSDHLPYARAGIPAIMFSTLLHADYHTPRDEPSRIDIAKLGRMTRWMYATGWAVAATTERPALHPGFRLER